MATIKDLAIKHYLQEQRIDMNGIDTYNELLNEIKTAWSQFVDEQPEPSRVWQATDYDSRGVILSGGLRLYYSPPILDHDNCWHIDPDFRWVVTDMQSLGRAILEYGNIQRREHSHNRPANSVTLSHEQQLIRVLERIAQALEWHAPF